MKSTDYALHFHELVCLGHRSARAHVATRTQGDGDGVDVNVELDLELGGEVVAPDAALVVMTRPAAARLMAQVIPDTTRERAQGDCTEVQHDGDAREQPRHLHRRGFHALYTRLVTALAKCDEIMNGHAMATLSTLDITTVRVMADKDWNRLMTCSFDGGGQPAVKVAARQPTAAGLCDGDSVDANGDDTGHDKTLSLSSAQLSSAVIRLAAAWVNGTPLDRFLEQIYKYALANDSTTTPPPPTSASVPIAPTIQENPQPHVETMTEKLARMRLRRTAVLTPPAHTVTGDAVQVMATATITSRTRAFGTTTTIPPSPGEDDASHFFTIETRLALQEQVSAVQLRLPPLLLRAKLAWMRCHTSPTPAPSSSFSSSSSSMERAAIRLLISGEALVSELGAAVRMARTPSSDIPEYKDRVAHVEQALTTFESLVVRFSSGSLTDTETDWSLPCGHQEESTRALLQAPAEEVGQTTMTAIHGQQTQTNQSIEPSHHGDTDEFVLPSMKKYAARVAPSYASYLADTAKTASRVNGSRQRRQPDR